jgi:histidinol-phosphatase (PHP family)
VSWPVGRRFQGVHYQGRPAESRVRIVRGPHESPGSGNIPHMTAHSELRHHRAPAQASNVPIDAHLHTDLSPDSLVPLELYVAQAYSRGIPEIAITDHLDFLPGAPAYEYADYGKRQMLIREAQERWAGKVTIRFGLELTYESRFEDAIREHLRTHSYEFVIGSVHAMYDGPYARERLDKLVAGRTLREIVAPYFAEVQLAIRSRLFDTIGHMDQCKRWLTRWYNAADFAAIPDAYEPLLRDLVESGTALEVNSSGLRHSINETYPGPWVVKRFRELGGTRVTTGSDAHLPDAFAFGLEEACEIVAAAGFDRLSLQRAIDRGDLVLPERFRK